MFRLLLKKKPSHTNIRRVGVFIDVHYIYHSVKRLGGKGKINYLNLQKFLTQPGALVSFVAFMSYDPNNTGQSEFLDWLAHNGFRVVSKPHKDYPDGSVKRTMDLEIAVEVLKEAPYLDEVVLVTGDGDFVPLVDQLCAMGKVVKVIGPQNFTAKELIRACHSFVQLNKIAGINDLD